MGLDKGTDENTTENNYGSLSQEQLVNLVKDLAGKVEILSKEKEKPIAMETNGLSAEAMATIIKAIQEKGDAKDLDFQGGIKEEQIPLDDYLKEGVRFVAPAAGYVVVDDVRMGYRVLLPYNKSSIYFAYEATKRQEQGKNTTLAPYSTYTSHSQKEVDWLRKHTYFGTMFYDSANLAVSSDLIRMTKLSRIMTVLKDMEYPDIVKMCTQHELQKSEDASQMRMALAVKMVDIELASEEKRTIDVLDAKRKSDLLLAQKD